VQSGVASLGSETGKVIDQGAILSAFRASPIQNEVVTLLYASVIRQVPVFKRLQDDLITKLCLRLSQLPALKGMPVQVQGSAAQYMYIVNEGRLQSWQESNGAPLRALCDLNGQRFWATVYDSSGFATDDSENIVLHEELSALDIESLVRGSCQICFSVENSQLRPTELSAVADM